MTGGAAAKARTAVYDLTLPPIPRAERKASGAQLVVPDPSVLAALDSDKIQSVTPGRRERTAARCAMERHAVEARPGEAHLAPSRTRARSPLVSRPLERRDGRRPAFLIDVRKFQLSARLPANRRDRALGQGPRRQGQNCQYALSSSRPLLRRAATRLPPKPPLSRPSAPPSSISSTGRRAPSARMRQRRRLHSAPQRAPPKKSTR